MTDPTVPMACNIDVRGARVRGRLGAASGVAAVLLAAALLAGGAPRPARLAVLPLAFGAALGALQARART